MDWWVILMCLSLEKGLDHSRNLGMVGRKTCKDLSVWLSSSGK